MSLDILTGKITIVDLAYIKNACRLASQLMRQNIDQMSSSFLTNLKKKNIPSGNYYWITINWDPKTFELDLIKEKLNEIMQYQYIEYYWYNYEQRSRKISNVGSGVHNHILICCQDKIPPPPSYYRRMIYRKVKDLVGTNRHIDIRKTQFPSDKIHYLSGHKQDGAKEMQVSMDRKYREMNNLETIYTNYFPIEDD